MPTRTFDPNEHFRKLINEVSHQILTTDHPDPKIAEICFTSIELVRKQRSFLEFNSQLNNLITLPTQETQMSKRREIPRKDLDREYTEHKKTINECAEFFNCSPGLILSRMREYGIAARPRGGPNRKKAVEGNNNKKNETPIELLPAPVIQEPKRHLERLILLSAVKKSSIQELLEEALDLLFEKHRRV